MESTNLLFYCTFAACFLCIKEFNSVYFNWFIYLLPLCSISRRKAEPVSQNMPDSKFATTKSTTSVLSLVVKVWQGSVNSKPELLINSQLVRLHLKIQLYFLVLGVWKVSVFYKCRGRITKLLYYVHIYEYSGNLHFTLIIGMIIIISNNNVTKLN